MDLNTQQECNPTVPPAVELARYAQTLAGERIVIPACARTVTSSHTVIKREEWERRQRERDQELLERLLKPMKRKARQRKRCQRVLLAVGSAALCLSVPQMMNTGRDDAMTALFVASALLTLAYALWGVLLHAQITLLVAHLPTSDIRAVGPLLEALHYADMEGIPQRALMELLPQITPADGVLFSGVNRDGLCRALSDPNTDLVVMALHALEKIGDGRCISHVAHLANGNGRARIDPHVLCAARRCLPILEARALNDTVSQTLLRPSAAYGGEREHLLRACDGQTETKARELLRSASEAPAS